MITSGSSSVRRALARRATVPRDPHQRPRLRAARRPARAPAPRRPPPAAGASVERAGESRSIGSRDAATTPAFARAAARRARSTCTRRVPAAIVGAHPLSGVPHAWCVPVPPALRPRRPAARRRKRRARSRRGSSSRATSTGSSSRSTPRIRSASVTRAAEAMAVRFRDAGIPGARHPSRHPARQADEGQPRRALSRPRRRDREADPAARASRRRRSAPQRLDDRSVRAHGEGRLLLRPRHHRRQGDGRRSSWRTCCADRRAGWVPDRDSSSRSPPTRRAATRTASSGCSTHHRDLIDAAYAINEGGGGSLRDGAPLFNSVQAAEKVYGELHARGAQPRRPLERAAPRQRHLPAGRRARPRRALPVPVQLNEVSRTFFERTAALERRRGARRCAPSSRIRPTARPRRRSRATRATTRCCAPPASRRGSRAGTPTTRCRRRRPRT